MTEIKEIFGNADLALLVEFIKQEAISYGSKHLELHLKGTSHENLKLNQKGKAFASGLLDIIANDIAEKCPEGFDRCTIMSYGNAGLMEYSLTISGRGKYFNWKRPSIVVNLCTCGKLDHWGSVQIVK